MLWLLQRAFSYFCHFSPDSFLIASCWDEELKRESSFKKAKNKEIYHFNTKFLSRGWRGSERALQRKTSENKFLAECTLSAVESTLAVHSDPFGCSINICFTYECSSEHVSMLVMQLFFFFVLGRAKLTREISKTKLKNDSESLTNAIRCFFDSRTEKKS